MNTLGRRYERYAAHYLKAAGLSISCLNYRTKAGEIDIIATDGEQLIFVEVKYRSQAKFGHAAEQVTSAKMQKLKRCAAQYLSSHNFQGACRFDVIAINKNQLGELTLDWIKNAF